MVEREPAAGTASAEAWWWPCARKPAGTARGGAPLCSPSSASPTSRAPPAAPLGQQEGAEGGHSHRAPASVGSGEPPSGSPSPTCGRLQDWARPCNQPEGVTRAGLCVHYLKEANAPVRGDETALASREQPGQSPTPHAVWLGPGDSVPTPRHTFANTWESQVCGSAWSPASLCASGGEGQVPLGSGRAGSRSAAWMSWEVAAHPTAISGVSHSDKALKSRVGTTVPRSWGGHQGLKPMGPDRPHQGQPCWNYTDDSPVREQGQGQKAQVLLSPHIRPQRGQTSGHLLPPGHLSLQLIQRWNGGGIGTCQICLQYGQAVCLQRSVAFSKQHNDDQRDREVPP